MSDAKKRNRNLILIVTPLFWFSIYVFMPYQTPYLAALGIASSTIGVIVGSYGFSQLVIRVPLGIFADRKSRHKPFIVLGAASVFVSSLLRSMASAPALFFVANLIMGLAASTWISFTVMFSSLYEPGEISHAMGTIVAMNSAGTLAAFITGTFVSQACGVPALFYISMAAAVIGTAVACFIKEDKEAQNKEAPSVRELLGVARDRRLLVFSVAAIVLQIVNMSTAMAFTSRYAQDIGGTNIQIGLCSISYMVMSVAGSYFIGTRAAARLGPRRISAVMLLAMAAYCALVPLTRSFILLYILQAVGGLGNSMLFSLFMSHAVSRAPAEKKSSAMGFFQGIYSIGMTLGPIAVGLMVERWSIKTAYIALAGLLIAAMIWLLAMMRKKDVVE